MITPHQVADLLQRTGWVHVPGVLTDEQSEPGPDDGLGDWSFAKGKRRARVLWCGKPEKTVLIWGTGYRISQWDDVAEDGADIDTYHDLLAALERAEGRT